MLGGKENRDYSVGVIIPCYNSEKTVSRAIESVLEQTEKVDEIILVDDGSTDNTSKVIEKYSGDVTYIYQENGGVSKARNKGIKSSTCNWIAFLDADDTWYKTKNEKQKMVVKKYGVGWCAGQVLTDTTLVKTRNNKEDTDPGIEIDFFDALARGVSFQTGAFLIKKDLITKVGLFDEDLKIAEDRDLWWKIALYENKIGYVNEPVVHYNEFEEFSLTKQSRDRTDSVMVLTRLLKSIKTGDVEISKRVLGYFTWMGFNYVLRKKSEEISVRQDAAQELIEQLQFSGVQKLMLQLFEYKLPFGMRKRLSYLVQKISQQERNIV